MDTSQVVADVLNEILRLDPQRMSDYFLSEVRDLGKTPIYDGLSVTRDADFSADFSYVILSRCSGSDQYPGLLGTLNKILEKLDPDNGPLWMLVDKSGSVIEFGVG